jgi:hypothetical protein
MVVIRSRRKKTPGQSTGGYSFQSVDIIRNQLARHANNLVP